MNTSKIHRDRLRVGMIVQDKMFDTLSLAESGWGIIMEVKTCAGTDFIKVFWIDNCADNSYTPTDWTQASLYQAIPAIESGTIR